MLRDEGHAVLGKRKERRRMSLLGSRRFMGDYLGVGNKGSMHEILANSAGIREPIEFSCKGELLVSKLGRSSKPSPRVLILMNLMVESVIVRSADIDNWPLTSA